MNIGKYCIDITDFSLLPWSRTEVQYDENGVGTVYNHKGWLFFVISSLESYYNYKEEN